MALNMCVDELRLNEAKVICGYIQFSKNVVFVIILYKRNIYQWQFFK